MRSLMTSMEEFVGEAQRSSEPKAAGRAQVRHLPGQDGLPIVGSALHFLRDARGFGARMSRRHGPVYRFRFGHRSVVVLLGADALEHVLGNREANFSSELGWAPSLGELFGGGLMLMDFEKHRAHRRIMNSAFSRSALGHYINSMDGVVCEETARWGDIENFRFYPAIKQLALNNAAVAFLGLELGAEADRLNQAFEHLVAASMALIRAAVPGTSYSRGLAGRQTLREFFTRHLAARRQADGGDMFTRLCQATTEDGKSFSDDEIVDHMIFLMMAAHDTITSTLTTVIYLLATHADWQHRLREEMRAAGKGPLRFEDLAGLEQTEWVCNEAMRLWCPLPYIARRALREFEWKGHRIPAHAHIAVSPDRAHHDPTIWTEPDRFDPLRFSRARAEHKRHPFAFTPYGGGPHRCIGAHFAGALAKVFLHRFLLNYAFRLPTGYTPRMRQLPIPKPADGLQLEVTGIARH